MPAPDLERRILAAAAGVPSPTRRQRRIRSALRMASAIAVPLALFVGVGGPRLGPRPLWLAAATVFGASALAAFALFVAVGRGSSMLGRPQARLLAVAAIAPIVLVLWKVAASWGVPHMMDPWPDRSGLRCFGLTTLLAVWPALILGWEFYGSEPVQPRVLGVALAVAAGVSAAALVDLWCPVAHVPHLLSGHLAPVLLLGGVGALVGARLLGIRARL